MTVADPDDLASVPADPDLDLFARLVRAQLGVSTALVSFVTPDAQLMPGAVGLPAEYQLSRRAPRRASVCQVVVADEAPLVVGDVRGHPRLADVDVDVLGVVAYAGAPLRDARGVVVGSLCAVDDRPREWTEEDVAVLLDLAAACSSEIALRQLREDAALALVESRGAWMAAAAEGRHSRLLLELSEHLSGTATPSDVLAAVLPLAHEHLGTRHAELHLLDESRRRLVRVTLDGDAPAGHRLDRRGDALSAAALTGRPVLAVDRAALLAGHPATRLDGGAEGTTAVLPLVVDRTVGVLVLAWPTAGPPEEDVRDVAEAMTRYTAQALARAELLVAQRTAATTLQLAMLTDLPRTADLELAERYVPTADGAQVGGDWYDAVVTPDGATHLVIGDVVGHDVTAAAAMGQLRSLVRSLVWAHRETPGRVLRHVDEAMAGLHLTGLATCLLARVAPPADGDGGARRVAWSSAGHLPPVLLLPDGAALLVEGRSDLLLGVRDDVARTDHELLVPPGSTLLLYTDGLVERRDRPVRDGMAELVRAVARHAGLGPDALADALLADMVGGHGGDDVALLVARTEPAEPAEQAGSVEQAGSLDAPGTAGRA